jgi:hypothetical protein
MNDALDSLVPLTLRHARTLLCPEDVPIDRLEARFANLAAVRDWILAGTGGCSQTRDLLLDLVSGRLSLTEAAEAAGWSVSKVCRKIQASLAQIRWSARLAMKAQSSLQCKCGFTLDPQTAEPIEAIPMWAVSLAPLGICLAHPATLHTVMQFLSARAGIFSLRRGRRRYFSGSVVSGGGFRLDVTVLLKEREEAISFARKHRQRSISYLASNQEIAVSNRECRRAA